MLDVGYSGGLNPQSRVTHCGLSNLRFSIALGPGMIGSVAKRKKQIVIKKERKKNIGLTEDSTRMSRLVVLDSLSKPLRLLTKVTNLIHYFERVFTFPVSKYVSKVQPDIEEKGNRRRRSEPVFRFV